jgi:hypothetical protein
MNSETEPPTPFVQILIVLDNLFTEKNDSFLTTHWPMSEELQGKGMKFTINQYTTLAMVVFWEKPLIFLVLKKSNKKISRDN